MMPLATSRSTGTRFAARALRAVCLGALVLPVVLASAGAQQLNHSAQPQAVPPPAASQSTPAPQAAAPQSNSLIDAIGRWFDQGTAGFRSHIEGANRSFDELNQRAAATGRNIGETAVEVGRNAVGVGNAAADVTKDAVGTVAKLPLTRVINGRERCELAPNGAPDCQAAAETLCRKRGFSTGKSADFTSAEQCTARAMLAGRAEESDCTTVTFITRAMCQ